MQGQPRIPLQIVYSEAGRLDLGAPIFNTPEVTAIVVTTGAGARLLRSQGRDDRSITLLVAGEERVESSGLTHAHERLFDEFGVRYLDCEGAADDPQRTCNPRLRSSLERYQR